MADAMLRPFQNVSQKCRRKYEFLQFSDFLKRSLKVSSSELNPLMNVAKSVCACVDSDIAELDTFCFYFFILSACSTSGSTAGSQRDVQQLSKKSSAGTNGAGMFFF